MSNTQRTLFWDGHAGLAYCGGMSLPLPRKPRVLELDIEQIEYFPDQVRNVQEVGQAWRRLTDGECAYIDAALKRMKAQGIQEIC